MSSFRREASLRGRPEARFGGRKTKWISLVVVAFSLIARSAGERASELAAPAVPPAESARPVDRELYILLGEARFEEVVALGRSELASHPPSCLPYLLVAKAAAHTGRLEDLTQALLDELKKSPDDLFLMVGVAQAHREEGRLERALQLLSQAVRRGVGCPRAYKRFVELSQRRGRLREAETIIEWLLSERPGDPFLLFARAYTAERRREHLEALRRFQEAVVKAPPLAITYLEQANLFLAAGEAERALFSCQLGLRLARTDPHVETRVELLSCRASALELLDRREESRQAFEKALDLSRMYRLTTAETDVLLQRAFLVGGRGRPELAARYVAQAGGCAQTSFLPRERGVCLYRLGAALAGMGKEEAAAEAFRNCVDLAVAAREPRISWEGRVRLGFILLNRGDREGASGIFTSTLREADRLGDLGLRARALSGLGAVQERVGDYRRGLELYRRSLHLARKMGDRRQRAMALSNIGLVYLRLGQPGTALVYAAQATRVARALGDLRLQVGMQQGLAAALAGLGNLRESQKVYEAALRLTATLSASRLHGLVLAGWARVTLELGDVEGARKGFKEALLLAHRTDNELLVVQALAGLGLAEWRRGDLEEAAGHFEEGLEVVESYRRGIWSESERMSYLETRAQVFSNLAAVTLERSTDDPHGVYRERAFRVIERSRSRSLLDILDRSRPSSPSLSMTGQADTGSRPGVSIRRLRREVLEPGELFLEYSLGEHASHVWAVTREHFEVFELPSRRDLARTARTYLAAVSSPPRSPDNPFSRHVAPASALFEELLGPVKDLLGSCRHLIVSADGFLYYIPFGALVVEQGGQGKGTDRLRYLVEDKSVSYVASAAVLAALRQRTTSRTLPHDFLGIAQPSIATSPGRPASGMGEAWRPAARIPFVMDEVEALARLFPRSRRRVLLGRAATESAVKTEDLAGYRIVHFATHALADGVYPERSAIYLAAEGSTGEDGALRMSEILQLSLASDLVVLSGCQTGLGRLMSAEGIVGLPWAFLSVGSSSVLVSLWNVNDRSTSELMRVFYERMQRGATRAMALKEAQKVMLQSERRAYRHPYYWAPFVLVGLGDR